MKKGLKDLQEKISSLRKEGRKCPMNVSRPPFSDSYCIDGKYVPEDEIIEPYTDKIQKLFIAELKKRGFKNEFKCDMFFNKDNVCSVKLELFAGENKNVLEPVLAWSFQKDKVINFVGVGISSAKVENLKYSAVRLFVNNAQMDKYKYTVHQSHDVVDFYSSNEAYNACRLSLSEKPLQVKATLFENDSSRNLNNKAGIHPSVQGSKSENMNGSK